MIGKLFRKLWLKQSYNYSLPSSQAEPLSRSLQANLNLVREAFGKATDLVVREFTIGSEQIEACLIFIDGLVDKAAINNHIMKSLMIDVRLTDPGRGINKTEALTLIEKSAISIAGVRKAATIEEVIDGILGGDAAVFIDGSATALLASTRGWETRSISEPETEVVVRGPREGFTETLATNTALLRRKIKNPHLQLETLTLGRQTRTMVCLAYIKGIANEKIVAEVKQRLQKIDTDAILESGYVEAFIEDAPLSIFPTIGNTEKPDVAAAKVLEGRIAIFVDGTPFALTMPYLLVETFQVAEDYYSRPFYATVVRWLRFLSFFLTVSLPAWYVALETFHQEMIPTTLLIPMAMAKEATPFPAVVEAMIMGVIFEILREAGVRLPRPVGQAISIVGALVIGEAAVSAGLIGAPMVIVIALTAITAFVVPALSDAAALVRLALTILSGFLGGYGIMWGLTALLLHLCSLRSFGVPYLSPITPTTSGDLKDVLVRAPLWTMLTRPRVIGWHEPKRQKAGLKPKPPRNEEKELYHPHKADLREE